MLSRKMKEDAKLKKVRKMSTIKNFIVSFTDMSFEKHSIVSLLFLSKR